MARKLIVPLWVVAVAAGLWLGFAHASTAGAVGATPTTWPEASRIVRRPGAYTVVMFVHPRCICTRASLSELAEIAKVGGMPRQIIVELVPETAMAIEETPAWSAAGQVEAAERVTDLAGLESARFGALTSGYVVVYDPAGRLQFAGGVTGSRGHVGDNVGRRQVEAVLAGTARQRESHPVFGCELKDEEP